MSENEKIPSDDQVLSTLNLMKQQHKVQTQICTSFSEAEALARYYKREKQLQSDREATAEDLERRTTVANVQCTEREAAAKRTMERLAELKVEGKKAEREHAERVAALQAEVASWEQKIAGVKQQFQELQSRLSV